MSVYFKYSERLSMGPEAPEVIVVPIGPLIALWNEKSRE